MKVGPMVCFGFAAVVFNGMPVQANLGPLYGFVSHRVPGRVPDFCQLPPIYLLLVAIRFASHDVQNRGSFKLGPATGRQFCFGSIQSVWIGWKGSIFCFTLGPWGYMGSFRNSLV